MFGVSAAFLAALGNSHLAVAKVEVLSAGVVVATLAGPGTPGVPGMNSKVLAGSKVTGIRGQPIRRSCSVNLIDDLGGYGITPTDVVSLLAPYGNELRLWRGIQYADGTSEFACLGVFEITDAVVKDTAASVSIAVSGLDRADEVARSTLTDTYAVTGGQALDTAALVLIGSVRAGLTFSSPGTTYVTPAGLAYLAGDDPWAKATALVQMMGAELYFVATGNCAIAVVDPTMQPVVVSFTSGPNPSHPEWTPATMTDLDRNWTNRGVPNNVIREGQGSALVAPVRGVAQDTDSNSPTRIGGPYGTVTDYLVDSKLLTVAQCQTAANAVLRLAKGKLEQLYLQAVPNPALDISDVVLVVRPRLGVWANYMIDGFTMPLDHAGKMDLILRRVIY